MSNIKELKKYLRALETGDPDRQLANPEDDIIIIKSVINELSTTQAKLLEAEKPEPCSCCLGNPISGKPCICGGANTIHAELQGFREGLYDTQAKLSKLEEKRKGDKTVINSFRGVTDAVISDNEIEIKDLKAKLDKAVEAIENIREFVSMIPLHLDDNADPHIKHFVKMAKNWCNKALTEIEDE